MKIGLVVPLVGFWLFHFSTQLPVAGLPAEVQSTSGLAASNSASGSLSDVAARERLAASTPASPGAALGSMPAKVVKAAAVVERLEKRRYDAFELAWSRARPDLEADMRLLFQRALEQLQGLENGRVLPKGHELLQPTLKKTALPDGRDRNTWRQEQVRKALL